MGDTVEVPAGKNDAPVEYPVTDGSEVNKVLISVDEVAQEVLAGRWGRGNRRNQRLSDAGHDALAVNKAVAKILSQ